MPGPPGPSLRPRSPGSRLEAALVAILIAAYLALMVPSLTRWPPVNNDEGREAQLSWVASGLEPGEQRMNAYKNSGAWGTGGLQGATTVALFWLFERGPLDASLVFQARLTSLLWGGLLLGVVYWLGRWYWNRSVGLAALMLTAVSNPFLLATHTHRPDVQAITLTLLALGLLEYSLASGRGWPAVLGGVCLILGFDSHMFTLGLSGFVLAALLVRHGRQVLWSRGPRLLLVGVGIGLVYYFSARVLRDPVGWLTAASYWMLRDKQPPVASGEAGGLLGLIRAELLRYADYFGITPRGVDEGPELGLVLLGLTLAGWRAVRGSQADRVLLLGLGLTAAFFVLVVKTKSQYYMVDTYPVHVLLIAAGLWQIARSIRRPVVARAGLATLVLIGVLWPMRFQERTWDKYVRATRYRAGQEYYELIRQLDELAGPGTKIMAPPLYWFGLGHHEFSDIFVYERVRKQWGETAAEFLDATRPDVVITDAKIATDRAIERELYRALDERAPYQLVVRHKNYGDVAMYRLSWQAP